MISFLDFAEEAATIASSSTLAWKAISRAVFKALKKEFTKEI